VAASVKVLQVSDTHLSPHSPYAAENWEAVVRHARRTRPDLVVHTGDISLDGAESRPDLDYAKWKLDELTVPWRVISGNHDIGDVGATTQPIDDVRRARFAAVFGDTFWAETIGRWTLVGVDAQVLMSPRGLLPDAESKWEWLTDVVLGARGDTVLFVHRPLMPLDPGERDDPDRFVFGAARDRLRVLIDESNVRVVASGHVHQWRHRVIDDRAHVWAPSAWAVLPDRIQPVLGEKQVGVVEHVLGRRATSELVVPSGVVRVVIGDDFASPYEH
jgi:3',5'-cyclic AMP phosphodiesterase CpdA